MAGSPGDPVVSVIVAVHRGEATIARAVASLLAQTLADWEAILVSDDLVDEIALLAGLGITDGRLRQVSTGRIGAGCAAARNLGLAVARGAYVTRLDADDAFHPERLERLTAIAARRGAAIDGIEVIDDATGEALWRPFPADASPADFTAEALGRLNSPVVPLVAHALSPPWFGDVDISEDVLHLFAIEERVGVLPVDPTPLYRYFVRAGSMSHGDDGAERADRSYAALDARLAGIGFPGIGAAAAARARAVFADKRAVNRAFAAARAAGRASDFQHFCAALVGRRDETGR
jgi:glycosyltransferase involved in cell wall biosynthesis